MDSGDNISNDFGKVPRNRLTTRRIISLTILVVIITIILSYVFYYVYTTYYPGCVQPSYGAK